MLEAHEEATVDCDHVQLHECGFDEMIWEGLLRFRGYLWHHNNQNVIL